MKLTDINSAHRLAVKQKKIIARVDNNIGDLVYVELNVMNKKAAKNLRRH